MHPNTCPMDPCVGCCYSVGYSFRMGTFLGRGGRYTLWPHCPLSSSQIKIDSIVQILFNKKNKTPQWSRYWYSVAAPVNTSECFLRDMLRFGLLRRLPFSSFFLSLVWPPCVCGSFVCSFRWFAFAIGCSACAVVSFRLFLGSAPFVGRPGQNLAKNAQSSRHKLAVFR